jgi:hypothetical protein
MTEDKWYATLRAFIYEAEQESLAYDGALYRD